MAEMVSISKEELEKLKESLNKSISEKSQVQEKLLKSEETLHLKEEYFRLVLDNSHDFIYSVDRQYHLVSCNHNYRHSVRSATGTDAKIQESVLTGYSSEIRDLWKKCYDRVLQGESVKIESQLSWEDGLHFFENYLNPIKNATGEIIGVVGVAQDITEHKNAENALKESEAKYRRLHESMTDAFAQIDMNGKFVEWNDSYKAMLGYTDEELSKLTYLEITPQKWHSFEHDFVEKQVLSSGHSSVYEKEFIKKDGSILPVELHVFLLTNDSNEQVGMWAIIRDISKRKKAEKDLLESESRYRNLFENSPVSLWEEDLSEVKVYFDNLKSAGINDLKSYFKDHPSEVSHCVGMVKIIDINKATLDIFKAKSKEELKNNLSSIFQEEAFYEFKDALLALSEGKCFFQFEGVNRTLQGDTINIALSLIVMPSCEICWSKIIVSIIDITERKKAEEALLQHERLLNQIFEILPVGLWIMDSNGVITRGNPAGMQIWGGAKFVGIENFTVFKGWWADSGKSIEPEEWAAARALRNGETSLNEEVIIEAFDGSRKTILNSAVPIRDVFQKITGAIIVNQDITKRKKAEEALHESEEIMRYIIKHDPNAIAVFDRNLLYIATSDRYLQDYNVKERNIIGKHHYDIFPEMPQKWKDIHDRVLQGEIIRDDDDSFVRTDGSITYTRWECRPWYKANGQIGGMIMYTEVTTERKLAELALASEKERLLKTNEALDKANARYRELDELKTKFVSVASHELRTPIVSIIGFAETLLAKDITISDQDRERYLRIIEKEGKRLGSLVQSLLDIVKIEKGGAVYNFEEFNIVELAQETINSIIIPAHLLVSVVQKTSFEPRILAVREQIRQIIRNLLDNAIRHTAPGGSITISIDHNQDNIIVSVKDTGTGIPENELKKIFERFHRVKGENGSKGEGSGLGLAIAKEIIEAHHGHIWVESTLGVGSTFYFTIPLKR